MKKKSYIGACALLSLLCAAALLLSTLFAPAQAQADDTAPSNAIAVVKPQTDCLYRYFTYPTALFADGNGFTVADGKTVYTFDTDGKELSATELGATDEFGDIDRIVPYNPNDNSFILLADGKLYQGGKTLDPVGNTDTYYSDFALINTTVYAIADRDIYPISIDPDENPAAPSAVYTHDNDIQKIAADGNGIYFTVANPYNRYQSDIFYVTFNELNNASDEETPTAYEYYSASDEIVSLEARENGVITLTRDKITAYTLTGTETAYAALIEEYDFTCKDGVTISANGDTVYGISQEKSVFVVENYTKRTEILASAHDDLGFYRANAGLASRKQMIAVADERNNRVQILREDGIDTIAVTRPKAVTIDYESNIYVAHDNRIDVYNGEILMRTLTAPTKGITFTALQIDSYNNIYALGSNKQVYYFAAGSQNFDTTGMPSKVIALSVSLRDDTLFVATADNKIAIVHNNEITDVITSDYEIVDICADLNNSIYALVKNEGNTVITKFHKQEDETYANASQSPIGQTFVNATKLVMNTVTWDENAHLAGGVTLSYGDLLVSDTGAHAVKVLNGVLMKVNEDFEQQPATDIDSIEWDTAQGANNIIWTVAACDVYEQAAEIHRVTGLRNDMRVIIPHYDESQPFQLIIADNLGGINEPPVVGYVRNVFIKERLPYAPSPSQTCYSYIDKISVYKFPTFNSPKLTNSLERNTQFVLLSFVFTDNVYGYTDNLTSPTVWYRVRYTDDETVCEGYVPCDSISMRGENPDDRNIYPRCNAKVIKTATLYEKIDGEMVEVTDVPFLPLEVGTEVEVVGAFDSSEKYTLIKYYHQGIGTVEFYVLTKTLKYRGVNKVTVIAIVLIILTVILAAILIARFIYVKRTRKLSGTK